MPMCEIEKDNQCSLALAQMQSAPAAETLPVSAALIVDYFSSERRVIRFTARVRLRLRRAPDRAIVVAILWVGR